jgi:Zn/Cd-binding protein ZinT
MMELDKKVNSHEKELITLSTEVAEIKTHLHKEFDSEVTILAINTGSNVEHREAVAREIIYDKLGCTVLGIKREMSSVSNTITVLRNQHKLRDVGGKYKYKCIPIYALQ